MDTGFVTAVEMVGNDRSKAKVFRAALREQKFPWHRHNDRWMVRRDSPEHDDMRGVLATMPRGNTEAGAAQTVQEARLAMQRLFHPA